MNRFTVVEEPMKDLKVFKPEPMQDERGYFQRLLCIDEFKEFNLSKPIVNINHSMTRQCGTIRGMHFQYCPKTETKIVKCIRGAIFDVVVDIRADSPTFLQRYGIELSDSNNLMLYIPEGFAHGFQALDNYSEIIYFVTEHYSVDCESGLNPFDKILNIQWPLNCAYVSDKDKNLKMLDDSFEGIIC